MRNIYKPEGSFITSSENREYISSEEGLNRAAFQGKILEGTAIMCDGAMRLHVDLYGIRGIIERNEAAFDPAGLPIKDIAIITRVGKPVCFKVLGQGEDKKGKYYRLSRRDAQLECYNNYIRDLEEGDVVDARVTHLESFGAFVDIGCGIPSLLPVDSISVSRISHPRDRLSCGTSIRCAVRSVDPDSFRIMVSMKELLGTWEENASHFEAGQTVIGTVRSIENYGIFIELTSNLAGLAELREDAQTIPNIGDTVAVYIKNIIPEKMKIKLAIVDTGTESIRSEPSQIKYYIDKRVQHISKWRYSPQHSEKIVESVFDHD